MAKDESFGRPLSAVCVFCGSSPGTDPAYVDAARRFGDLLGRSGRTLVYGGGRVGMMGEVADAVLAAGSRVIGVIPRAMVVRELAHPGASEMRIVETMHQRKALMSDLSDAFVALPGGIGTMEELFEVWTWAQLGVHDKPVGLLDAGGFFQPLIAFVDGMVQRGFLRAEVREILIVDTDPARLLARMATHVPAHQPQWMDERQT
jgi:uncharacterized protein (TIGR00730 family)